MVCRRRAVRAVTASPLSVSSSTPRGTTHASCACSAWVGQYPDWCHAWPAASRPLLHSLNVQILLLWPPFLHARILIPIPYHSLPQAPAGRTTRACSCWATCATTARSWAAAGTTSCLSTLRTARAARGCGRPPGWGRRVGGGAHWACCALWAIDAWVAGKMQVGWRWHGCSALLIPANGA